MDIFLALCSAASSGLISLVLVWAILSTKFHDGVITKAGLISMALGFGSVAIRMLDGLTQTDAEGLARSLLLINAGMATVILGYLARRKGAHHPVRRETDWADIKHKGPT